MQLVESNSEPPPTIFVTNQGSVHSVLKALDGILVVKSFARCPSPTIRVVESSDPAAKEQSSDPPSAEESDSSEPDRSNPLAGCTFTCDSCDERFEDSSSLIIHKTEKSIVRTRAALREPLVKYSCDMCQRLFASKGMLARHYNNCAVLVETDSGPPDAYVRRRRIPAKKPDTENAEPETTCTCTKCDKIFKKLKYLRVHMATAHGEDIVCQLCEAPLESMTQLKDHLKERHTDERTQVCPTCNKGFYLRQSLKVHMAAHTRDDKLLACDVCSKSFRHEVYLRKHVQRAHVENQEYTMYRCDVCGYETRFKTGFREHMYKHNKEDQVQCDVCGKQMRKGYMKIHARIHTGEKPEICEYCGKGFSARKYLTKHRVTHTGEKPYECQLCGKKYTQRGTLTLHIRRHHPGQQQQQPKKLKSNEEATEREENGVEEEEEEQEEMIEEHMAGEWEVFEDGAMVEIVKEDELDGGMVEIEVLEEGGEITGEVLDEELEADDGDMGVIEEEAEIT